MGPAASARCGRGRGVAAGVLSVWLAGREYLEDRFSAADLLMNTVLRNLRQTDLVTKMPVLEAYRLRCEARPAFRKAQADQMATSATHAPAAA